jgi:hypothetical protein
MSGETRDDWTTADDARLAKILRARAARARGQEMPALAEAALDLADRLKALVISPQGCAYGDERAKRSTTDETTCAACGALTTGECSIHRDGYFKGPEVELCDTCGGPDGPTCEQLFAMIRRRQAVERLDLSKPPPEGGRLSKADISPEHAIAEMWAHYQARHDPPGMYADPDGEWGLAEAESGTWLDVAYGDDNGDGRQEFARAAAWRWYLRRLVLAERVARRQHRLFSFEELIARLWPRALTWPDDQCEQIEEWVVNPTAELPEVLRG